MGGDKSALGWCAISVSYALVTVQEWCKSAFVGLRAGDTLLLVVSQNSYRAVRLRNPHAQIYVRISRGISYLLHRLKTFRRLTGDNNFLICLLPGLLSSLLVQTFRSLL